MEFYHIIKGVHMLTACLTAGLMLLRLGLDAMGRPGWRETPCAGSPMRTIPSCWPPLLDSWQSRAGCRSFTIG